MEKKKLILIVTLLSLSVVPILFALNNSAAPQILLDTNPVVPEGPGLVVPENPIGTLGLISGLAAAFVVFAIAKKR